MRMKGRRLALLLAGALPLLADKHDVAVGAENLHGRTEAIVEVDTNDENDGLDRGAAEALHDDALNSLPSLQVDAMNDASFEDETNNNILKVPPPRKDPVTAAALPLDNDKDVSADDQGRLDSDDKDAAATAAKKEPSSDDEAENTAKQEASTTTTTESQGDDSTEDSSVKDPENVHNRNQANKISQDEEGSTNPATDPDSNNSDDNNATADDKSEEIPSSDGNAIEESKSEAVPAPEEEDDEDDFLSKRPEVDYASKSAGALILEKSHSMKGTNNLLNSDRDKYAIAPCEDKKLVVISLSEDILVEQVKIANYERYSSRLDAFQILGSQDMANWADFGYYKAHSGNGEQIFDLQEPGWARYLKFRFISHHGNEYYCTVSQIKVHGKTNLQDFKERKEKQEEQKKQLLEELDEEDGTTTETMDAQPLATASAEDASSTKKSGESGTDEASVETAEISSSGGSETAKETPRNEKPEGESMAESEKSEEISEGGESERPSVEDDKNSDEKACGDTIESNSDVSGTSLDDGKDVHAKQRTHESDEAKSCKPQKLYNDSDLPDALMSFQWEGMLQTSITLSSASFDVSSAKSASAPRAPAPETLDIHALGQHAETASINTLKDAVNVVISTASDYSISDALGDLKKKMKTTIETTIGSMTATELNRSKNASDEKSENNDNNNGVTTQPEEAPIVDSNNDSFAATNAEPAVDHQAFADDVNEGLSNILKRFPSSECLKTLNYSDFKAKIIKKAASGGATTGGAAAGAGKNKPIFETLTDEIHTLQINQSVQDQFAKALVGCYQRVLLDMSGEIQSLQTSQQDRLSQLEAMVKEMKVESDTANFAKTMASFLAFVSAAVMSLIAIAVTLSQDERLRTFVATAIDEAQRIETQQMKLAGVVLFVMLLVRHYVYARRRPSQVVPASPIRHSLQKKIDSSSMSKLDPPEEIADIQEAEQVETRQVSASKETCTGFEHKVETEENREMIQEEPALVPADS